MIGTPAKRGLNAMQRHKLRMCLAWAMLLSGVMWSAASIAAWGDPPVSLVARGKIGANRWSVVSAGQGKQGGICLLVGVFRDGNRGPGRLGESCSKPSPKRGIVVVTPEADYDGGRPKMVAVGGAFNSRVKKVLVSEFDGVIKSLRLQSVSSPLRSAAVRYRYFGLAMRGPWCVRTLTSYDRGGRQLWQADWRQWSESLVDGHNQYDPERLCPKQPPTETGV